MTATNTAKPIATATLTFVSAVTGKLVRAKVKVTSLDREEMIEEARRAYPAHLKDVDHASIKITTVKIPQAKLGTKLLVNHDYLMLTAVFPEGTFRFTTARYSDKMTGDFVRDERAKALFRRLSSAIQNRVNNKPDGTTPTVGEIMNELKAKAEAAKSASELFTCTATLF